jgi:hypothetical protein
MIIVAEATIDWHHSCGAQVVRWEMTHKEQVHIYPLDLVDQTIRSEHLRLSHAIHSHQTGKQIIILHLTGPEDMAHPNLTAACVRIQTPPFSKRNLTLLEGCRYGPNSIGGQVPTDPQQLQQSSWYKLPSHTRKQPGQTGFADSCSAI